MSKSKILITGAGGLIGLPLVENLSKNSNYEIFALTSGHNKRVFAPCVHHLKADLLEKNSPANLINEVKPDVLVHLAWSLSGKNFMNSPENIDWERVSRELLNKFIKFGGKRFLFAGSSAEYGLENAICSENCELNPENLYGKCKKSFSEYAKLICDNSGIKFAVLRFFPVYGEGDIREKAAIPQAIRSFIKNEKFLCKSPENVWNYIYKDDAAAAAAKVLESGFCGPINISDPTPLTMRHVFTSIAKEMRCENLLEFGENKNSVRLVADTNILNDKLNFTPKTSFEEGLKKTIHWWKDWNETIEKL